MIRAVYDYRPRQTSYILYSLLAQQTLRYAPPVEAIQREVIRLRNDILLAERALSKQQISESGLFERITPEKFPEVKGFLEKEIREFSETWRALDNLEKKYVRIFSRFVANEHFLARVGIHGSDQVNGLAGLWLDSDAEKAERFAIFKDLSVQDIVQEDSDEGNNAFLVLTQESPATALVNFRVGDIAVLYPMREDAPGVLKSQIYKCVITALGKGQITVRLRSRQVNYDDIRAHERWSLEHDLYDRSFNAMHSALFTFAKFPAERRSLFLGRSAPNTPDPGLTIPVAPIGHHQQEILTKMIRAKDYFLLWGPPGTGKTNVILHHLVRYHLFHTRDRIVLLAYTNRAVDEICETLDAIGGDIRKQYVRVGSRIGTGDAFTDQLLASRIRKMTKRKEVIELMQSQRIIVGTIAALAGKTELFRMVRTDVAIVDEASQILEPMLAGVLPAFRKWVLIGDHHQLPAVVAQSPSETLLGQDALPEIALADTRDSYFERMYHVCSSKGWDWAYGNLTEQGRMHEEIMAFPSRAFYHSQLQLLHPGLHNGRDYSGPLVTPHSPGTDPLSRALATERMLWIPSGVDSALQFSKTHDEEARDVVECVRRLTALYGGLPDIGVITPFRAQIANIRALMQNMDMDPDALTIDTVERYQGSARDIIILSLSIHHPDQLLQISSPSREGIDRKLNVALTRARQQFILIAARAAILGNPTYAALCNACTEVAFAPKEVQASL